MKPKTIRIKRGLNLPIDGRPDQTRIVDGNPVRSVAVLGPDYPGMKPRLAVKEGDSVKSGQLLFVDRKRERIRFTAPGAGTVRAIHRGEKRRFLSLIIDLDGDQAESFQTIEPDRIQETDRETILELMLASGLFTALRQRPFDRIPDPESEPYAIFVPAMDTRPLAGDPRHLINEQSAAFTAGLKALTRLTSGMVHLCREPGEPLPGEDVRGVQTTCFAGPHPAGLSGTHIHFLNPAGRDKHAWTIGYADVVALGSLILTGKIFTERIVSLAGPSVTEPKLIRTRTGANLDELVDGQLKDGEIRVISGSVLYGRTSEAPLNFLGCHHNQISALPEGRERRFLGWMFPDSGVFSVKRGPIARLLNRKGFRFTTNLQGSLRANVPIGVYEKVMPLDILPTFLVRSMVAGDLEESEALGALELAEEDMSLCTFVDPGKGELDVLLRDILDRIEREG